MNYRRPCLLMAVMFVLGECISAEETGPLLHALSGAAVLFLTGAGLLRKKVRRGAAALLLFVFLLGFCRYHIAEQGFKKNQSRILYFGELNVALTGKVVAYYSSKDTYRMILSGSMLSSAYGSLRELPETATEMQRKRYDQPVGRIMVYLDAPADVYPGHEVRITGKMTKEEQPQNEGQFDYGRYLRSQGISGSMYGKRMEIVGGDVLPLWKILQRFREWCQEAFRTICTESGSGIYQAVLLGERGEMPEEISRLFQESGISHILAVSGLHLSILGMGFYNILRKGRLHQKAAGIFAGILILLYGTFTGCSGSAMRAVIMLLLQFLARSMGRTYDMLSAVGVAAVLLLLLSPYLLFTGGFQLSFAAVLSIGLAMDLPKLKWQIVETIRIALLLQLGMLPIVLYHYFKLPLYSLLLNLLVLPLMGYVLGGGILALALYPFSTLLARVAIGGGHMIIAFYKWLCEAVSTWQYASLVLGRPGMGDILVYYGVLLLLFCILERRGRRQERTPYLERAIILLIMFIQIWNLIPDKPQKTEITALYVGQGDGFIIRNRDIVVTMDQGSTSDKHFGENVLEPYLLSQGISCIDASMISHCDSDHYSGILYLLTETSAVRIRRMILPAAAKLDSRYDTLRQAAAQRNTEIEYMQSGDEMTVTEEKEKEEEKLVFQCIYPVDDTHIEDANTQSLGVLLTAGRFRMLFTGDMPKEAEEVMLQEMQRRRLVEDIDVLKVGHHGSATSTSELLLETLSPAYALISYGRNNDYGHPHQETMEKLRQRGIRLLETARLGEIRIIPEQDGSIRLYHYRKAAG